MREQWKKNTLPRLKSDEAILDTEIDVLKKKKTTSATERENIRKELEGKMKERDAVKELIIEPALSCSDVTVEKLAVMLKANREQLASLSPDAGPIVSNLLGRHNKAHKTDDGIYLTAYSGDSCRTDRMGRESVELQSPCLSVLWLTQPDKIETLLGERSLTDGGLIPRFLTCHTNARPLPIIDGHAGISAHTCDAWNKIVESLINTFRMASEPVTLIPTDGAAKALNSYYNSIVMRRSGELRDVPSYAARWGENAWRVAVCIHAGRHGEYAGQRQLDLETAQNAIAIVEWFSCQQLEILTGNRDTAKRALRDKVLTLLADKPDGITIREVQRARVFPSTDECSALLDEMASNGVLHFRDIKPERGGHATRVFTKAKASNGHISL